MSSASASQPPIDGRVSTVVANDGTRLYARAYDYAGEGSPSQMILCDGILCDGFIWRYLREELRAVAPVVHWNYRGHGRSGDPVSPRVDIAQLADDLAAVRAAHRTPRTVLVGHSMGCQVALEHALSYPEGIEAIVLICGSFGRVTHTFHGTPLLGMVLPQLIETVLKFPEVARAFWSRVPPELALKIALATGEVNAERINPADMLPYMQHMTHVDLPLFLRMLRGAGEHSAWDRLRTLQVPVLVVAGERDTFTPAFLARAMSEEIPRGEMLFIPGGTHVASLEHHAFVDAKILEFLRKHGAIEA
jgi:pimeloyl-ACP methyl ester carboxylesterase